MLQLHPVNMDKGKVPATIVGAVTGQIPKSANVTIMPPWAKEYHSPRGQPDGSYPGFIASELEEES